MKVWWVGTALALMLLGASCGSSDSCGDVCAKAQSCGALPGPLGGDVRDCTSKCGTSTRGQEGIRLCLNGSSCAEIQQGRCGSW